MKTKTILTLLTLTLAQSASALTVNAALDSSTSVSAPVPVMATSGTTVGVNADASNTIILNADATTTVGAGANVNTNASGTTEVMTMNSSANTVSSVNTDNDDKVTVTYKRPAKLFGFIPVSITERATVKVEDDGTRTAEVSQSWWAFMAKANTKTKEFLAALKSRLQANANVSSSTTLTATEKTQYVTEINAAADAAYSGN
ncbi:MAG: hypothetical protein V4576_01175 [Patescibacteria group bacterium]